MSIAVVYESMFGSTRQLATAIANTLAAYDTVAIRSVNDVESVSGAELLVIGGPTHAHGMSRPATRAEAVKWADDESKGLSLEPSAPGIGVREWIEGLETVPPLIVAFDSRIDTARIFSGAASGHMEKELLGRGARALVPSMSFLVSGKTVLQPGELERAHAWAVTVGEALAATRVASA